MISTPCVSCWRHAHSLKCANRLRTPSSRKQINEEFLNCRANGKDQFSLRDLACACEVCSLPCIRKCVYAHMCCNHTLLSRFWLCLSVFYREHAIKHDTLANLFLSDLSFSAQEKVIGEMKLQIGRLETKLEVTTCGVCMFLRNHVVLYSLYMNPAFPSPHCFLLVMHSPTTAS